MPTSEVGMQYRDRRAGPAARAGSRGGDGSCGLAHNQLLLAILALPVAVGKEEDNKKPEAMWLSD
jgi:hypothetical protein